MYQRSEIPEVGAVFCHVGNGDSTTLLLGENDSGVDRVMQVDLHHMTKSEDDDETTVAMIGQLIEILPEVDGKPYLAVFALTHPDEDHCKGFAELLEQVMIGELWMTPRSFDEYDDDLCDDAQAFSDEAERRVEATSEGNASAGDRIRVIGRADLFDDEPYSSLPESVRSTAGSAVCELDGDDVTGTFAAFIHAPFFEASDGESNDNSLAMRVSLSDDDNDLRVLLLGDLAHDSIAQIYANNDDDANLEWDVLLAAHHCSKKALFDDEGTAVDDVVDGLTNSATDDAWVVSSSRVVPATNETGDDPPHRVAWDKYGDIVGADRRMCTADHGSEDDPDPISFSTTEDDYYVKPTCETNKASALAAAVTAARPRPEPPRDRTGYGTS